MADGYEVRAVPSAADDTTVSHRIGVAIRDDITGGSAKIRSEQFMQVGHPLQYLQATASSTSGVTVAGFYPQDSANVTVAGAACAAAATASITFATGAPNWDITGWCVGILSGTGVGQVRRIIAYTPGTLLATVDRNWSTTPTAGDQYTIGFDCSYRSWLVIKAECEGTAAQSPSIIVLPYLIDYARNPPTSGADQGKLGLDGVARAPIWSYGSQLDLDNYDVQGNTQISNYYHMRSRSDQVLGACLAKIRLHAVPGSGKKVALWVSAV